MKIIDISIPLTNTTPVWKGDKKITIRREEEIGDKSSFNVSRMELGVHAGTHIDAPFHCLKEGQTVDQLSLSSFIGPVQVIQIPDNVKVLNADVISKLNFENGIDRVLFKTSNSKYWETDPNNFHTDYVAFDTEGARAFSKLECCLVGIDYFSASLYTDLVKPHEILLNKGIILLENIDLRAVDPGIYKLICLPLKLIGTDGAPARAILIQE